MGASSSSPSSERSETLEQLGEWGLLKKIQQWTQQALASLSLPELKVGIGDDAAVLNISPEGCPDCVTVISTDMFAERVHFDVYYTPMRALGYKIVMATLSDICAMNALPRIFFLTLALDRRFNDVGLIEDFFQGVLEACQETETILAGGDTIASTRGLYVSGTAVGWVSPSRLTLRSGARPGDLICVSGDLGAAYLGLHILEREREIHQQHPLASPEIEEKYAYLYQRLLKPRARLDLIRFFHEEGIHLTAMTDISDGLALDLLQLCEASGTGCVIYEDSLPMDPSAREMAIQLRMDPTSAILSGGEDYELLFTLPGEYRDLMEKHPDFTIIGEIRPLEEGRILITRAGRKYPLRGMGWDAFQETNIPGSRR